MDDAPQGTMRYWNLYITTPGERYGKQCNINKALGVVAPDLKTAIQIVADAYPEATFWTAQHRGTVDLPLITFPEYDVRNYHDHDKTKA